VALLENKILEIILFLNEDDVFLAVA